MGIVLGKYLVFDEGGSLESRMASMTVEQIHAFRLSMLENTLEPYKYLIMVLMCVLFLFMLTRFPTVNPGHTALRVAGHGRNLALSGSQPPVSSWRDGAVSLCGVAGGGMVVHHSFGAVARGGE